jgi:DNA invertase Pin-like site-specific DNA recombinase
MENDNTIYKPIEEIKQQKKYAIYVRISTDEQDMTNQIETLKTFAYLQNNNITITKIYKDIMTGGSANRPEFRQMLFDARLKKFDTIIIWSLDRFSREGINNTLSYLKRLKQQNIAIKSLQEPWLDTTQEGIGELLIAIFSWVAQQERKRISERTKTGLINAKNVGKRGKDKKPRNRLGYYQRWVNKGG